MVSCIKLNTWIGVPRSPGTTGRKKVKCCKLCAMVTIFGQKNRWCKLKMMTFQEVKGQQRSNILNNTLWLSNLVRRTPDGYHIWSKELLMQAKNEDDLCGGQRSTEVKYSKQCSTATKLGQKSCLCMLRMMMTFVKVKGQQRSNIVNCSIVTKLCQKITDDDDTFIGVKGQQRSNVVKYVLS